MNKKIFILIIFIAGAIIFLPSPKTIRAEVCSFDPATAPKRASNLIQTPLLCGPFGSNSNTYVLDPQKAPFVPYKLPGYDDLKSVYFDQKKEITGVLTKHGASSGNKTQAMLGMPAGSNTNHLFYLQGPNPPNPDTGNLTITNVIDGPKTAVIFVDGNLNIDVNINYNYPNAGLVFVVKGDVNIASSVTNVDAVIISSGVIYTAGAGCGTSSHSTAQQLIINGSLISLRNDGQPGLKLCRQGLNSNAGEVINNQVKYLVILRNVYSDTLQRWSEIQ